MACLERLDGGCILPPAQGGANDKGWLDGDQINTVLLAELPGCLLSQRLPCITPMLSSYFDIASRSQDAEHSQECHDGQGIRDSMTCWRMHTEHSSSSEHHLAVAIRILGQA